MPLISVIVPVYKVEPYLHRCVDSILAQTFTDFELILVDDGSPDNCGAICDEYAAKDGRVRVIHQKNGGLSAARNAGIDWAFANSDSQWLTFIDSDDWVHPCFLEYLYRAVEENQVSVSACGFKRVEEYEAMESAEYSTRVMEWDKFYLQDPVIGAVATCKLYQKELFSETRYPSGKLHEDEFVTYRLLYKAGGVAWMALPLYLYYQNPESIMKGQFSLKRLNGIQALGEQCAFARKIGNEAFYYSRAKARLDRARQYADIVSRSEDFSSKDRKVALRYLNRIIRLLLVRDGRVIAPIKQFRWYYEQAFPKLSWCYWICVGIAGKIKRMVKRNAND